MDELNEEQIIANLEAYIKNTKDIIANNIDNFTEEEMINLYTLQKTLEGMLNLYKKHKVDLLLYKDHMRVSICPNCGEKFYHKRSDAKYCSKCSSEIAYSNWKKNLTEEQKRKRSEYNKTYRKEKYKERKQVDEKDK